MALDGIAALDRVAQLEAQVQRLALIVDDLRAQQAAGPRILFEDLNPRILSEDLNATVDIPVISDGTRDFLKSLLVVLAIFILLGVCILMVAQLFSAATSAKNANQSLLFFLLGRCLLPFYACCNDGTREDAKDNGEMTSRLPTAPETSDVQSINTLLDSVGWKPTGTRDRNASSG